MPQSDQLFKALLRYHQQDLPQLSREIDNGHPTANTKDRLRDLHKMFSVVIRYLIVRDAEVHGVDASPLVSQQAAGGHQAAAQLAPQYLPSTAQPSLGAPAMPRQQLNVIVGSEPQLSMAPPAGQELALPEPSDKVQIVTGRNGMTTVIPPLGSRAPVRTFPAGQGVDATYISQYDNPPPPEV